MKTFSAYLLAGGKSSRMGTDKGLQLLNETPLIAYVIDNLKKYKWIMYMMLSSSVLV